MSIVRRPVLSIACGTVLCAMGAGLAPPAWAYPHSHNLSAGTACHPANGGAAPKFLRNTYSLVNNNTTDQFVVCHIQMDDDPLRQVTWLRVHATAGAAGGTLACTAQTVYYAEGVLNVVSSVTRSGGYGPNESNYWSTWGEFELIRPNPRYSVVINCKVPPGFRLGQIELQDAD